MKIAIDHVKGNVDRETIWRRFYTSAIPCGDCDRGENAAQSTHNAMKKKNKNATMPITTRHEYALRVPHAHGVEQVDALIAWAREYVARQDEQHANRDGMTAGTVWEVA